MSSLLPNNKPIWRHNSNNRANSAATIECFMEHALNTFYCRGALGTTVNLDIIGCVWTCEFDLNTLRVDGKIFKSGKKKLRIQKYPDTCGGGLGRFLWFLFLFLFLLLLLLLLLLMLFVFLFRSFVAAKYIHERCWLHLPKKSDKGFERYVLHHPGKR